MNQSAGGPGIGGEDVSCPFDAQYHDAAWAIHEATEGPQVFALTATRVAGGALEDQVFAFGGIDSLMGGSEISADYIVWDPVAEEVTASGQLPEPRMGASSASLDAAVFFVVRRPRRAGFGAGFGAGFAAGFGAGSSAAGSSAGSSSALLASASSAASAAASGSSLAGRARRRRPPRRPRRLEVPVSASSSPAPSAADADDSAFRRALDARLR